MILTSSMRAAGEMAVRSLSAKAQRYYNGTYPLCVYEYAGDDDEARYSVRGALNKDGLSFCELNGMFEDMQDIMDEEMALMWEALEIEGEN